MRNLHSITGTGSVFGDDGSDNLSAESALDDDAVTDGTVSTIEHLFDGSSEAVEEQDACTTDTETGTRSSARPRTGSSSPNRTRRGRGSLGVLMPTVLPLRSSYTGRNPSDVGSLTHLLIGAHVQFALAEPDNVHDLIARMYAVSYAVIDANPNARRVLATEAVSLAHSYLTNLLPAHPWRLLGVEYETGQGRADVAWVNDQSYEVFFDEVKTSRVSNGRHLPPNWVAQATRYAAAGMDHFGEDFLGTRLVALMGDRPVRLVRVAAPMVLLSPTASEPMRLDRPRQGRREGGVR